MKNVVVKQSMMPSGIYTGTPCMIVDTRLVKTEAGITMSVSDIKEELVKKTQFSDILMIGDIVSLHEVIIGMNSLGKNIYIQTELDDRIDSVRMLRNIRFRLNVTADNINSRNIVLLKSSDEIMFDISSLNDYEEAKKLLFAKNIKTPVVIFRIAQKTDYLFILREYFKELGTFGFKSRVFVI